MKAFKAGGFSVKILALVDTLEPGCAALLSDQFADWLPSSKAIHRLKARGHVSKAFYSAVRGNLSYLVRRGVAVEQPKDGTILAKDIPKHARHLGLTETIIAAVKHLKPGFQRRVVVPPNILRSSLANRVYALVEQERIPADIRVAYIRKSNDVRILRPA